MNKNLPIFFAVGLGLFITTPVLVAADLSQAEKALRADKQLLCAELDANLKTKLNLIDEEARSRCAFWKNKGLPAQQFAEKKRAIESEATQKKKQEEQRVKERKAFIQRIKVPTQALDTTKAKHPEPKIVPPKTTPTTPQSDSDEVRAEVSALEETLKRTAELKREADDLRHEEEALPSEFAQKEADREAELLRKRQELYDRYDAILEKSLKAIDEHAKREYALQEQIAETKFGWLNQSQKKPWLEEQKRAIELQASEARQKAEQENSKSKRLVKTTLDNAKAYGQALAESPEPPASEQPLWHHDGMAHGDEVSKTEQLQAKRNERARDAAFGAILTGGTAVATSIAALVFYYHQQKLLTRMRALSGDKNILNTIETSPQKLEPKHAKELKQLYARYTSTKTRALSSGIITAAAAALTIPLAMGASHYKKIANGTT